MFDLEYPEKEEKFDWSAEGPWWFHLKGICIVVIRELMMKGQKLEFTILKYFVKN